MAEAKKEEKSIEDTFGELDLLARKLEDKETPVSYTHLDVYKRQVYLLVFTLLMNSFSGLSASLLSMLAWITEFMKELSPVYFMAVAAASGASSAAAFYQGVLLLVWLFQWILERVLPVSYTHLASVRQQACI